MKTERKQITDKKEQTADIKEQKTDKKESKQKKNLKQPIKAVMIKPF